jgi:hypothetical protein
MTADGVSGGGGGTANVAFAWGIYCFSMIFFNGNSRVPSSMDFVILSIRQMLYVQEVPY